MLLGEPPKLNELQIVGQRTERETLPLSIHMRSDEDAIPVRGNVRNPIKDGHSLPVHEPPFQKGRLSARRAQTRTR